MLRNLFTELKVTSLFVDATTLIIEATYDAAFNADLLNSSSAMYRQTTESLRSQVGHITYVL